MLATDHHDTSPLDTAAGFAAAAPALPEPPTRPPADSTGEAELVHAFATHELVQEALRRRSAGLKGMRGGAKGSRIPTTLRAIERRWFVGRQTIQKAVQKTTELGDTIDHGTVAASDALVGTAALLALSQNGSGLVTLLPREISAGAGQLTAVGPYREMQLRVRTAQRGGSSIQGARKVLSHKRFFIHQTVVTACLEHANQFNHRQLTGTLPTSLPTSAGEQLLARPAIKTQHHQRDRRQEPYADDAHRWLAAGLEDGAHGGTAAATAAADAAYTSDEYSTTGSSDSRAGRPAFHGSGEEQDWFGSTGSFLQSFDETDLHGSDQGSDISSDSNTLRTGAGAAASGRTNSSSDADEGGKNSSDSEEFFPPDFFMPSDDNWSQISESWKHTSDSFGTGSDPDHDVSVLDENDMIDCWSNGSDEPWNLPDARAAEAYLTVDNEAVTMATGWQQQPEQQKRRKVAAKRSGELLVDRSMDSGLQPLSAQSGTDLYSNDEKRPSKRRKTETLSGTSGGLIVATATLALLSLVFVARRGEPSPPISGDKNSPADSPVASWHWELYGIESSMGSYWFSPPLISPRYTDEPESSEGSSNRCMWPTSGLHMCEAGRDVGHTCFQNVSEKWPVWKEWDRGTATDVATACEQGDPGSKQMLQGQLGTDAGQCRVAWGMKHGAVPGESHITGLERSGAVVWSTDHQLRIYFFASAYPCNLKDMLYIGSCGVNDDVDDAAVYGDSIGGVWTYSHDLGDGTNQGWHHVSNSQIRAATLLNLRQPANSTSANSDRSAQSIRTLPPARNSAVQWNLGQGSLLIMGGRGCTVEPYGEDDLIGEPYGCGTPQDLSDMWFFNASTGLWSCLYMPEQLETAEISSVVTLGEYQWNADDGGLPVKLHPKQLGLWPVARRGRASWTTCDSALQRGQDCDLWLFGGAKTDADAIEFRVAGEVGPVQFQEEGSVDSLWRYSVSVGMEQRRGEWLLVTGWDDATMCRLQSPSAAEDGKLCRGLTTDAGFKFFGHDVLNSSGIPVESCPHVWPRDRVTGEFVPFDKSKCPPGRHGAAAWSGPPTVLGAGKGRPAVGGWIFGGLNSLRGGFLSNLDLGEKTHDDPITEAVLETYTVSNQGPPGYEASMMFDDLWQFNGDAIHPRWVRVPQDRAPLGRWPMAGSGHGWTTSATHLPTGPQQPSMWMWLWISQPEPWGQSATIGGVTLVPSPSQLWAFSVDTRAWQRADPRTDIREHRSERVWPATRHGALIEDGWIVGGVGQEEECAQQPPAGQGVSTLASNRSRELSGLWRLADSNANANVRAALAVSL